jgi:transcription termination factor Rho
MPDRERRVGAEYRRWSMESEDQRSEVVSEQPTTEVETPKPRTRAPRKRVPKTDVAATAVAEPADAPPVPQPQTPDVSENTDSTEIPAVEVSAAEPSEPADVNADVQPDIQATTAPRPNRPHRDRQQDRRPADGQQNGSGGSIDQTRPQEQRGFRGRQQRDRDRDRDRDRERERQLDAAQRDGPTLNIIELDQKELSELQEMARELEVPNFQRYRKADLIIRILQAQTEAQGFKYGEGVLDVIEDGFGFLRGERYLPGPDDIYVSQSQIRRFGLRTGDKVSGQIRPPKDNEKFHSLLRVEAVNGLDPETARRRPNFDTLTPIFPLELIDLETQPHIISTRLLNLVAPIGRGQRGLIVSPPKAGKTLILKAIANGVTTNYSDIHLMVCLIGERPEEVTDMKRSVDGEVISSTFDEPVEDHTKVAEMALDRAKRLVEGGRDVVILLDSITRLARAYNLAVPPSGRTLSGGIDPIALYPPKRFFGAARNIEGGGSLTIVATCLVDTGSRMDDVIYEEFKGTGNMELHLDRKLAERRIYPAIDIQRSGTRREDLLLDENTLRQVYTMRRMVSMLGGSEGTELLLGRLAKTANNPEFLLTLTKDM